MHSYPDDDIEMIKSGRWAAFALAVKRPNNEEVNFVYEFGCIFPKSKNVVVLVSIWDFDPAFDYDQITYESVEALVGAGWMVD